MDLIMPDLVLLGAIGISFLSIVLIIVARAAISYRKELRLTKSSLLGEISRLNREVQSKNGIIQDLEQIIKDNANGVSRSNTRRVVQPGEE